MVGYAKNALGFDQWFATEEACRDYLWRVRYPDGFICARCGCREAWLATRGLKRCRQCEYQVSATAGTIFQGTRKPLRVWFLAMWYVVNQKQGVSALGLHRVLGLGSYRTAWTWMHKLRVAMVRPGRDRLAGTVEVDESYVGGERSGKRGRGAEGKVLVVIAAQEDAKRIGRIGLCRVPDASGESLQPAVEKAVEPGSTVRTDGWSGYSGLGTLGYVHDVARSSAHVAAAAGPPRGVSAEAVAAGHASWFRGRLAYGQLPE